jgi:hypothetical protein
VTHPANKVCCWAERRLAPRRVSRPGIVAGG